MENITRIFKSAVLGFLSITVLTGCNRESSNSLKSENPGVYIISPAENETVTSPVTVKFGVKGMEIVPAGTDKPHSGHHHLLIDVNELPDLKLPIPADQNHRHFGKGQTETNIELAPGKHTLQLILGDMNHVPHNPPLISKKIEITVK